MLVPLVFIVLSFALVTSAITVNVPDMAPQIVYFGDWKWQWQTSTYCSRFHHTSQPGSFIELSFRGTAVYLQGSFSNHPLLNITVDTHSVVSTDSLSSSPAKPCTPFWSKTDLSDDDHVVTIEYLRDDAASSQPSEFYFYGFEYEASVPVVSPSQPLSAQSTPIVMTRYEPLSPALLAAIITPIFAVIMVASFLFWMLRRRRVHNTTKPTPDAAFALKLRSPPPQSLQRPIDTDAQSIISVDTLVGPDEQKKSIDG